MTTDNVKMLHACTCLVLGAVGKGLRSVVCRVSQIASSSKKNSRVLGYVHSKIIPMDYSEWISSLKE